MNEEAKALTKKVMSMKQPLTEADKERKVSGAFLQANTESALFAESLVECVPKNWDDETGFDKCMRKHEAIKRLLQKSYSIAEGKDPSAI